MAIKIYHVNAFSTQAFSGNPAAVCILDQQKSVQWMQSVAAQMRLSETAFVYYISDACYELRWFTPNREVDMCGHATLASAHSLWQNNYVKREQSIEFQTKSGPLSASLCGDLIELDFPVTYAEPTKPPHTLIDALGISAIYSAKFGEKYLLQVSSEEELRALNPDYPALLKLAERGVTITCESNDTNYDFVSRYFAPWVGIDEDPVNGSSHCALTPFWAKKLGRSQLKAYQASSRGGELILALKGERVRISGYAKSVLSGQLLI